MRERIHVDLVLVIPAAIAALLLGCSTTTTRAQASREASIDLSRYTTWSWLLPGHEDETPHSELERELAASVVRQVRRELHARGFVYRADGADLGIEARLTVRRQKHVTRQSTAVQTLHSLHSTPSFEVQATQTEIRNCERGRLRIRVVERASGRELWRGDHDGGCREEGFASHVREAVSTTLATLPAASGRGDHQLALGDGPAADPIER